MSSPLADFHPAVAAWFRGAFAAPTAAQAAAWPSIRAGRHTLVAAPTGSGKTLTAFLAAIDELVREGVAHGGTLADATTVLYVSPLKALSNDIHVNLEAPLESIRAELEKLGLPDVAIRTAVRTGDTPQVERNLLRKQPPHILVTTPESLYVLLGSASGRSMLASVRTVIVDEIHAIAGSKRGSHLALSLERLQSLCQRRLLRIGLSATQKPIEKVADFLVGAGEYATLAALAPLPAGRGRLGGGEALDLDLDLKLKSKSTPPQPSPATEGSPFGASRGGNPVTIIDVGHTRPRDLAIEVPPVPLEAVMSNDAWEAVYDRLAQLVRAHRTTLVFVNTRRMAERAARHLSERLGKEHVAAHHGSLAKELRLDAEQRLKRGELKVLVATASLELGIDIGEVDLVCQLGSPRSIAAFLQRAGRSGHSIDGTPKARLFPATRDDLIECTALLDCVRRGELDALVMPPQPLDVLAQQIVAEVACTEWDEDALYALVRRAYPYRELARADFDAVVRMLAEGFTTRQGLRAAYIHRDAVNRQLRPRRSARLTALTSGGTIPDTADYKVVLEPQAIIVGTVNEDFAVESMAGDIFQLGNASYRIQRVERDRLRVEDAHGAPPSIPFWLGEAPGRSDELSFGVSRLREELSAQLDAGGVSGALAWLHDQLGLSEAAAQQLVDYLARAKAALGVLPSQHTLVLERFFDESGGTQLVVHTPWGSRINRAWGLALRKRFCRQFNFELQAAATEDAIVLSLSTSHSFPLEEVAHYLHSNTAEHVLVQALLDAPLFPARWRWNAVTALALPRFTGGKKTPPPLQRMKSEDLLAAVFPDQVACLENIVGEREVPDHPLVNQTLHDCLREAMDVDGLLAILRRLEAGEIAIVARDLSAPSPLAAEVLNAAPYAFLDDAPLEERRTQAVQTRRWNADSADDLGRLDPDAIAAVREEAWPQVRDADEMHEALTLLGFVTAEETAANSGWQERLQALAKAKRATRLGDVWTTAEQLPLWQALHPAAAMQPPIAAPAEYAAQPWTRDGALQELVRHRLGGLGPVTTKTLAASLAVEAGEVEPALLRLQSEGYVMQGRFSADAVDTEWCERHLLARIHRYTIGRLRREIEPVSRRALMRFLFDWQHVSSATKLSGPDALAATLAQLEGYEAAAGAWEAEILPARIADYSINWLDELCRAGRIVWSRLRTGSGGGGGPVRGTPIVLLPRRDMAAWTSVAADDPQQILLSSRAQAVADALQERGALFFDELLDTTRLLRTELEDALGELVATGRVSADSFAGLRALLLPAAKRDGGRHRRLRRHQLSGIEDAGRWALARVTTAGDGKVAAPEAIEHIARTLLRRYGVVFWRLLEREAPWLPPWRELLRVYHRLEARGEIRGGRFVEGLVGEQFALPEAIAPLRAARARADDGELVCLSGSDPLNLVGTVLAGDKVPALPGARMLYRDGAPIAALVAGRLVPLTELPAADLQLAKHALLRHPPAPPPVRAAAR
ncbi:MULTISPECIES: DEAD/DEAH box helicase [Rhodanobacter]|uniref:DEAD/DEAH box helicase n=1 Tax=Rhodanobacter TaxID=75309 RepID=UPI0004106555|nr:MULTISPECIES: DEAD/DEAH box helicase [Rhodanobacter]KZC20595.1 ATP-dependent DNA helicase [Rhodanobacter denitrificans]UJJ51266.1 DEAD/DEAH box helicase [Rhodanobacter denitrificans]UJM94013.1 DEAD/DEAH box helicase [Rhodanobacter denitrificans]UJM97542.1 DEAD/DEAH box helicase [Rhodanobacter denitrificans]UJN23042.1 DEAD/DEAH box helicase [Rhodanobacter denitrificans]